MTRWCLLAIALFSLLFVQGCEVVSPNGFFSVNTEVRRQAIVGAWEYLKDGKITSRIEIREHGTRYRAILIEREEHKRSDRIHLEFTLHDIKGQLIAEYRLRPPRGAKDLTADDLMWSLAKFEIRDSGPVFYLANATSFEGNWREFARARTECGGVLRGPAHRSAKISFRRLYVQATASCLEEFVSASGDAIWEKDDRDSSKITVRKRK